MKNNIKSCELDKGERGEGPFMSSADEACLADTFL